MNLVVGWFKVNFRFAKLINMNMTKMPLTDFIIFVAANSSTKAISTPCLTQVLKSWHF